MSAFIRPPKISPEKEIFLPKDTQISIKKTLNYRYRKRIKKSQWNQNLALDIVTNNGNNVANIGNIGKTMNRHMQQIDQQTGEVVEGFVAYVVPKRKNGFQKGWMAMAQEAMMMLAQSNLTGNDMKVMWAMLARLDYENLIQVNQSEVAEQVGMNRHHVNRSIKKLIEMGVVLEGVKIGISRSYRLNPNFGWKGSAKGHREALHEHLKVVKQGGMVAIGEAMSQCHQPQFSKCTHYTLCQVVRSYKTITLK